MADLQILYGVLDNYQDVTQLVFESCKVDDQITIPITDGARAQIFGDPVYGTLKHIKVITSQGSKIYAHDQVCQLDVNNLSVEIKSYADQLQEIKIAMSEIANPEQKLAFLHSRLNFTGGNIRDEYAEQVMAVLYLKPEAKVLELGSNIGRNTLIAAYCLSDQRNLVTLECDPHSYKVLMQNRDLNNCTFRAENAALSYQKLIQLGWNTIPNDEVLPGYTSVNTITFEQLETKHDIQFDTMVVDCEGALYYILKDNPSMLDNITMLIMENDYTNIDHKNYIDELMTSKGLSVVYSRPGPWGACTKNFYEVWAK